MELYAILNYLYPTYFTSPAKFEDAFDITHNKIDPDMLLKANKLLKLFMIRRLKCEVEKLMPKKIETKVCIYLRPIIVCTYSSTLHLQLMFVTLDSLSIERQSNLLVQRILDERG